MKNHWRSGLWMLLTGTLIACDSADQTPAPVEEIPDVAAQQAEPDERHLMFDELGVLVILDLPPIDEGGVELMTGQRVRAAGCPGYAGQLAGPMTILKYKCDVPGCGNRTHQEVEDGLCNESTIAATCATRNASCTAPTPSCKPVRQQTIGPGFYGRWVDQGVSPVCVTTPGETNLCNFIGGLRTGSRVECSCSCQ